MDMDWSLQKWLAAQQEIYPIKGCPITAFRPRPNIALVQTNIRCTLVPAHRMLEIW